MNEVRRIFWSASWLFDELGPSPPALFSYSSCDVAHGTGFVVKFAQAMKLADRNGAPEFEVSFLGEAGLFSGSEGLLHAALGTIERLYTAFSVY